MPCSYCSTTEVEPELCTLTRTTNSVPLHNWVATCSFQPIDTNSCQVEAGPIQPTSPKIVKPDFGPRPGTNSTNFDFKMVIDWLPFQLNIRKEANLMEDQQSCFINLVNDNEEDFSLHDEDLGYCNQIKHMILTMTDKPVYFPQCTIPRQIQGEVHKFLDTWLCQGII